jgi:hypothetical protein
MHLMRAQQLLAFLLRHGRSYPTGKHWTKRHRSWLAGQTFHQQAHGIVFQDYLETVWTAQERRDSLCKKLGSSWALSRHGIVGHPIVLRLFLELTVNSKLHAHSNLADLVWL